MDSYDSGLPSIRKETLDLGTYSNSPEQRRVVCGVGLHDVSDSGDVVCVVDRDKVDGEGFIAEAG